MAKYDDALKALDEFTKRFIREETLIPLAYQKIVALQLKKGNKEEALKTLDRISGAGRHAKGCCPDPAGKNA